MALVSMIQTLKLKAPPKKKDFKWKIQLSWKEKQEVFDSN